MCLDQKPYGREHGAAAERVAVGDAEGPSVAVQEGFLQVWSARPDAEVQAGDIGDPCVHAAHSKSITYSASLCMSQFRGV